jgi:hypothetical protein
VTATTYTRTRAYLRLPVNADDGFPQAFRMTLGRGSYLVALYVNVVDEALLGAGEALHLPLPGAFMVMVVSREGPGEAQVIFQRKLVLGHEYDAAELAFVFQELTVDPRNLNAAGAFGSRVTAGVAARWAL